jgi:hypothetical protein
MVRGFKKRNLKAPAKRAIWDAAVLLNYYRTATLFDRDDKAQYRFLQTKAIALIMFFCLTHIQETALLRVDGMIENTNAIWLHTIVKGKGTILFPVLSLLYLMILLFDLLLLCLIYYICRKKNTA